MKVIDLYNSLIEINKTNVVFRIDEFIFGINETIDALRLEMNDNFISHRDLFVVGGTISPVGLYPILPYNILFKTTKGLILNEAEVFIEKIQG